MATQKYVPHVKTSTGYSYLDLGQINTYVHSYNATTKIHNLVGSGSNIRFYATATFNQGDQIAVNGTVINCVDIGQNLYDIRFLANTWVTGVVFENNQLFFSNLNRSSQCSFSNYATVAGKLDFPRFKYADVTLIHNYEYVIEHKLNTLDLVVMFSGTLGDNVLNWTTDGPNKIIVRNSSNSASDWHGTVSIW